VVCKQLPPRCLDSVAATPEAEVARTSKAASPRKTEFIVTAQDLKVLKEKALRENPRNVFVIYVGLGANGQALVGYLELPDTGTLCDVVLEGNDQTKKALRLWREGRQLGFSIAGVKSSKRWALDKIFAWLEDRNARMDFILRVLPLPNIESHPFSSEDREYCS